MSRSANRIQSGARAAQSRVKQGRCRVTGTVTTQVYDKYGKLRFTSKTENLLTNAGKEYMFNVLFERGALPVTMSQFKYIGLGNAALGGLDVTDTALETEITGSGLGRAIATSGDNSSGDASISLAKEFTATADVANIGQTGLYNAASAGILGHVDDFDATFSLKNKEKVKITWEITIS